MGRDGAEACREGSPDGTRVFYYERVLLVITEDWFVLSHFRPLLTELRELARDVVVVTHSSGRLNELQALGVRTRPLNLQRGSFNPLRLIKAVRALIRVIDEERPDAVHAIALQPMALVSMALNKRQQLPRTVFLHLTGLGYLAVSRSFRSRVVGWATMRAMKHSRAVPSIWVLAENEDDLNYLLKRRIGSPERSTLIPGAGVEAPMPAPFEPVSGRAPVAVFVGRMVRSKGVHTLVEAYQRLTPGLIHLALYGAADVNNPEAIPNDTLTKWSTLSGLTWHGHVQDIAQIWTADQIAVIPSLGGEGMPRAMLEAAASGRPLIVSDVPGCRHFVRQGVEGLVVPPGDVEALANALAHLAKDQALRRRLGLAARGRFLAGFTTDAVRRAIHEAYRGSAGAT